MVDFPDPDQPPDSTLVLKGVEQEIYSDPCSINHRRLFIENGRLVGWTTGN